MQQADVMIAGAGIAGLSLALKLRQAGRSVLVLESTVPGAGASRAAAGMLAAHDPANPPELAELAERSIRLYPDYLAKLAALGGEPVPFETSWTLERCDEGAGTVRDEDRLPALSPDAGRFCLHPEQSLDPRKLFASLVTAVEHSGITLLSSHGISSADDEDGAVRVTLEDGSELFCKDFVDCTGAWSRQHASPVKGQMLRLQLPPGTLHLPGKGNIVVRTPEIYLVPRLDGTCLVGATIEHAGFDTKVRADATKWLQRQAVKLVPALAAAPELESWCGLRPGTANSLPVLGAVSPHCFVGTGLYRNGILLAPAVAESLAALVQGEQPAVDLSAFLPRLQSGHPMPSVNAKPDTLVHQLQ